MKIKPVLDEPAIIVEDFLVVSDLHIGIENEFYERAYQYQTRQATCSQG